MINQNNIFYSFARILKSYRAFMDYNMSSSDMTTAEISVLVYLLNNSSKNSTSNDIVKARGFSKALVSKSVNSLIEKGIIESIPNPDDKRYLILKIRDEDSDIIQKIVNYNNEFKKMVLNNIDDESLDFYMEISNKMLSNIDNWRKYEQGK